jgi:hypothetical protein
MGSGAARVSAARGHAPLVFRLREHAHGVVRQALS